MDVPCPDSVVFPDVQQLSSPDAASSSSEQQLTHPNAALLTSEQELPCPDVALSTSEQHLPCPDAASSTSEQHLPCPDAAFSSEQQLPNHLLTSEVLPILLSINDQNLPCPESALSPSVHQLITETGICHLNSFINRQQYLTESGLINWNSIGVFLPDEVPSSEYFIECVRLLAPCFSVVEIHMSGLTNEQFETAYGHLCEWTKSKQIWMDTFSLLQTTQDETGSSLALLIITAYLENSIGDVFLLHGTQCPSMLKDLLVSTELEKIFGSKVMQILRVIIGPPISLNLRNVAWHGFPSCGEIPNRYTWFLLLIIPSLGQILIDKNIKEIVHRQMIDLSQFSTYEQIFPDVFKDDFVNLMESSHFVSHNTHLLWKAAVDCFENGRYGFSLVLIFPQLEHGLRRVFSVVNNCPHRVLTAEATTLYTTFDEILQYRLPDGMNNKIAEVFGESCMDLLLDILIYCDGPRARDRLSHGESDLYNVPRSLASAVFVLSIIVAARFVPTSKESILKKESIQNCLDFGRKYESVFHPVSLVKQKVNFLSDAAAELNMKILYTYDLHPRSSFVYDEVISSEDIDSFQKLKFDIKNVMQSINLKWNVCHVSQDLVLSGLLGELCDGRKVISTLLDKKISTLYQFQYSVDNQKDIVAKLDGSKQCEIVGILLKIIEECNTFLSQTVQMLCLRQDQLSTKSLRSRQRDNLQRLIKSCPYQHLVSHLVIYIVICQLYSLDITLDSQNDQQYKKEINYSTLILKLYYSKFVSATPPKALKGLTSHCVELIMASEDSITVCRKHENLYRP